MQLTGLIFDEEFVAWDVGQRFAFSMVAASRLMFVSISERITIDDLGGGRSMLTYTQAFAPNWWFALPLQVVAGRFRRNLDRALVGLAARVTSLRAKARPERGGSADPVHLHKQAAIADKGQRPRIIT